MKVLKSLIKDALRRHHALITMLNYDMTPKLLLAHILMGSFRELREN